jgi:Tfp pilus assembly protein PilO
MLAATIALHVLFVEPAVEAAEKQRVALKEARETLYGKAQKERELLRLVKDNAALQAGLAKFDKRIPGKQGIPALFADVAKLAEDSKLKILQTKPGEAVAVGSGFQGIPYQIEVQGSYHEIATFVGGIESHERFVQILSGVFTGSADDAVRAQIVACLYASGAAPQAVAPETLGPGPGKPMANAPAKGPGKGD